MLKSKKCSLLTSKKYRALKYHYITTSNSLLVESPSNNISLPIIESIYTVSVSNTTELSKFNIGYSIISSAKGIDINLFN